MPSTPQGKRSSTHCHMTKDIVDDGTLGKLACKYWEIQRRVTQGTLKPDDVLRKLQTIIENSPSAMFDIERPNYVVGEKGYDVTTKVKPDFFALVQGMRGPVFCKTFLESSYDSCHYEWSGTQRAQNHKRRLRLAQVDTSIKKSVIKIQARQNNHVLADEWDLLAFFEQSGFREIIHQGVEVHALGGYGQLKEWWDKKGTSTNIGVRRATHLFVRGSVRNPCGWALESYTLDSPVTDTLTKGDYILLRDN